MRASFLVLSFVLFSIIGGFSQTGHKIEFELENYDNDTLIIGYYFADRQLVEDTLLATANGKFVLEGNEPLNPGIYLMLVKPDNSFLQFMVNEREQDFKIKTNALQLGEVSFKNTKDNDLFYDYLSFLKNHRPKSEELKNKLKVSEDEGKPNEKTLKKLDALDNEVLAYQQKIIADHPDMITSLLIKGNIDIDVPEFQGTKEEVQEKSFNYYKAHFFDNIEFDNPASIRTPFFDTRIKNYIDKLIPQHPDSLTKATDFVLEKLKTVDDAYKFYLSKYLNEAVNSKVVGMDAIYVHLVDNYYKKGKAPWVEEETMQKLTDNADRLRPVLIGKTVPDVELYREDGTPLKLSDIDTDYTVIMFWAPDCGHCKKSMPAAIEFNEAYKDKNVTMLAVCTKHTDKYPTCWEYIKKKENMEHFLNVGDEFHRSRFKRIFNVRSTPMIYILDRNREILVKSIGTKQLGEVMDQIIALQKMEERG